MLADLQSSNLICRYADATVSMVRLEMRTSVDIAYPLEVQCTCNRLTRGTQIVSAAVRVWRRAPACRHPPPRSLIVSRGRGSFPPSAPEAETILFLLSLES